MTVLNLTRSQVAARAVGQMLFLPPAHRLSPPDYAPLPIAYRLDDSGLLGGDDPEATDCADWSYGYRRKTADCVGFALWAAGIARKQKGFKGLNGEWLNTDSVLADAEGDMRFFRPLMAGERARVADLVVSRSRRVLGRRVPGHIGVLLRPRPAEGYEHMVIDCSPRHGRDTAIGVGTPWSKDCHIIRPLFYKETV
jgi:hypothetical protein